MEPSCQERRDVLVSPVEQLTSGGLPVTANAVDPGMVDTALYDNLWSLAQAMKKPVAKILFRTPAEGAATAIYAAAAQEVEEVGGCYLYNGHKTRSSDLSYDSELQAKLWRRSCELVGLKEAETLCGDLTQSTGPRSHL